jgi:hypothetical protein
MAQTTFTQNPEIGLPGMPVDDGDKDDISTLVETVLDPGIAPGLAVIRGTLDDQAQEPQGVTFTADEFLGCTVRTHKARQDGSVADNEIYADEERMPVRRSGRIWVTCEDGCTAGEPAFARYVAGAGGSILGSWRTDVDTASAVAVAGARFVSTATAGELAKLELNGL